jgi:lipopolysaccharide/colanic/teichoic acid biosynthesis glycosyltransferase
MRINSRYRLSIHAQGNLSEGEMIYILGRIVAAIVCLTGLPFHLVICWALRLQDGGSSLYSSSRLGRGGRTYAMLKYRTMVVDCSPLIVSGLKMIVTKEDPRVTLMGKWLRCGIDELPQLWNIIKGEME